MTLYIEEIIPHSYFSKIIILYLYFLFYLSICLFLIFPYLLMINRLYTIVNRLYIIFTIIN